MVIAFANNQVMVAASGTTSTIYTDPVPLNGNDRATAHLFVESIFNADTAGITYTAQFSNDGTNWVDSTDLTDTIAAVTTAPRAKTKSANGAFLRFKLAFAATGGTGGVTFDLHVLVDHA